MTRKIIPRTQEQALLCLAITMPNRNWLPTITVLGGILYVNCAAKSINIPLRLISINVNKNIQL